MANFGSDSFLISQIWTFEMSKFKNRTNSFVKKIPRQENIVDTKNESLGWFDLGNHIIILGVILLAIFIVTNA